MFKIQIRKNGTMIDYNLHRFDCRKDAGKFLSKEKFEKNIWADMRVVRA